MSKEAEKLFIQCALAECERLLARVPSDAPPDQMFLISDRLEEEPARTLSLPARLPSPAFPFGEDLHCSFRMPATPWGYKLHMAVESKPAPFLGRLRPSYCLELEVETDEGLFHYGTEILEGPGAGWAVWSGGVGSLAAPHIDLPIFPQSRLESILESDMDVLTATGVALELRTKFARALAIIQARKLGDNPSLAELASLEADLTRELSPFTAKEWA